MGAVGFCPAPAGALGSWTPNHHARPATTGPKSSQNTHSKIGPLLNSRRNPFLNSRRHEKYTEHVARQLALAPLGTRVVTYCGICEEVPLGYECIESSLDYGLKFWEKTKNHPIRTNPLEAPPTNNKWRFMSDAVRASGLADKFFG
jgi:hypothetical protein